MPSLPLTRSLVQSLLCLAILLPLTLLVLGAMSTEADLLRGNLFQPSLSTLLDNLNAVAWGGKQGQAGLLAAVGNTAIIAAATVIFQVGSSVLAAFGFAFFNFRFKRAGYAALIFSYLIPPVVSVVPLFFVATDLGLKETALGIALPYLLFSPYALVMLRGRFESIPRQLLQQGILDGLGPWKTLWYLVLPLCRPFIAIIGLVTFISAWNSFLWPRLIAGSGFPQVTVALGALQGQYSSHWNLVLAGTLIALLPAIVAFAVGHRQLMPRFVQESQE